MQSALFLDVKWSALIIKFEMAQNILFDDGGEIQKKEKSETDTEHIINSVYFQRLQRHFSAISAISAPSAPFQRRQRHCQRHLDESAPQSGAAPPPGNFLYLSSNRFRSPVKHRRSTSTGNFLIFFSYPSRLPLFLLEVQDGVRAVSLPTPNIKFLMF